MGILTASRLLHFRQTSAAALAGHGIILTYCQGNQKDKQKGVIIVKTEIQYLFLKSQYWLLFCSLLFTIFQKGTLKWIRTFSQFLTPFFFFIVSFSHGILSHHFLLFNSDCQHPPNAVSIQVPPFLSAYLPFSFIGPQDNSDGTGSLAKLLHKAESALSSSQDAQGFIFAVLTISKHGDRTTSLGNMFQNLVSIAV